MKTKCRCIAVIVALLFAASVHATDFFVDASVPPGGLGGSWTDPFNSLTDALDHPNLGDGDEIFVAQGNYSPGSTDSSTIEVPEAVAIYGGFQNGDIFGQQDPQANPTILDGGGVANHVVTLSDASLINGFTVTGGNALFTSQSGGGILIAVGGCGAIIANRTITRNDALLGGGCHIE